MEKENKYSLHTYSYLSLRKAVGWIGMSLPFVLMLGVILIFNGNLIQESISHYYYTDMRNVFVGALCAVGLFLFFYSGYNQWDNWAGNLAAVFAIGVAWFPTTESGSSDTIGVLHFVFATCFFLTLASFSLFLFTKKGTSPTKRKLIRNRVYIICGSIMILCLLAIIIYIKCIEDENSSCSFVFWAETVALVSFGISWLVKGGTLYRDKRVESRE